MSFSSVHSCPTTAAKLVVLLCFVWPFVAVSMMSRRGRSASPVTAALVPLAVSGVGLWLGLENMRRGLSITGGGHHAAAAGIAEALAMFLVGGFFALGVIGFAALRWHRPIVDRMTAILVAVFIVDLAGALLVAPMVGSGAVGSPVLIAGAIVAGVIAAGAMAWTFLTGRGRLSSNALPYGLTIVAILIVGAGVILWQRVHEYTAFAMGR